MCSGAVIVDRQTRTAPDLQGVRFGSSRSVMTGPKTAKLIQFEAMRYEGQWTPPCSLGPYHCKLWLATPSLREVRDMCSGRARGCVVATSVSS